MNQFALLIRLFVVRFTWGTQKAKSYEDENFSFEQTHIKIKLTGEPFHCFLFFFEVIWWIKLNYACFETPSIAWNFIFWLRTSEILHFWSLFKLLHLFFWIKTTLNNSKIKMKIFSILTTLNISAFGASLLKRSARSVDKHQLESGLHRSLENLMRKSIMQDLSTYYDVMLSGAGTLAEVNAVLAKRDPHFIGLSQEELDLLVSQWLFQMLSK